MKRLFATALIVGAFFTRLGLGTWQVQRLAWKQDLIAQAEERPSLPAVALADLISEHGLEPLSSGLEEGGAPDSGALAYRRVSVEGRFVGEPVRVFTTLSDPVGAFEGPGYWMMQPFEIEGDTTGHLFVNRGFIPFLLPDGVTVTRPPEEPVSCEGLVRPNAPVDWMTPDPDLGDRIAYRRDIAQMAMLSGIEQVLPITVDMPAGEQGVLPQAGETKFAFSNRHLEYAITWYALTAVLVGVVGTVMWQRRRSA